FSGIAVSDVSENQVVISKLLLITAQNSEALEKLSKNHKLNIKIKFIRHLKSQIFYNSGSLQLRTHLKSV
ncbi:hypothetical protein, partial [Vibrio sp. 10N.222.46.A1]|uniref:hypothetical protein n=1 Tax=Vibrio sp. 10N.222.46.A1 TaxID=3229599 RepID=UPI0035508D06